MALRTASILVLLWLTLANPPANAAPDPRSAPFDLTRLHVALPGPLVLTLPGELDFALQHLTAQPLGPVPPADGSPDIPASTPTETALFTRLRLSPTLYLVTPDLPLALWRLTAELDLLRDWSTSADRSYLAIDPRARPASGLVGQRLSQLNLAALGPHVGLQLGLTRSQWGLGLLSNAGADPAPHTADSPFGFPLQGDHVVRAGLSAFPLGAGLSPRPPLTLSLAFDTVIDDDLAVYADGDRAYQLVAAVLGHTDHLTAGFSLAHRFQTHHQGGDTNVTVFDLFARITLAEADGVRAFLEAEIATIRGNTSLPTSAHHIGAQDIDQLGALVRFGVERGPFLGVLELAGLSGDTNPFDDEQRQFAADRDHRAGLLLFRELMTANTAVTAANLANPDYRGDPPPGYERLATQGAARGLFYANPRVSFALATDLHLYAGLLYATTDGENVDPFWSSISGGAPRGPRDGPPATDLGLEVDLGLSLRIDASPLALRFRAEAAYFAPGKVFADADGVLPPDMWGAFFHGGLQW